MDRSSARRCVRARHDAPPGVGAEHGLARGVVGIGDTDEARIGRFAAVPEGVFVWTRDTDGMYWLGRIAGPLRASDGTAGLTHVRAAEWLERTIRRGRRSGGRRGDLRPRRPELPAHARRRRRAAHGRALGGGAPREGY
jgi:hypothetical protein